METTCSPGSELILLVGEQELDAQHGAHCPRLPGGESERASSTQVKACSTLLPVLPQSYPVEPRCSPEPR